MTDRPLLVLAPALADEDWETAAFARMLVTGVLGARPNTIVVAPEEAARTGGASNALRCRLASLTFGFAKDQLVELLKTSSVGRVLVIGEVSTSILEALAGDGADVRVVCLETALSDAMTPGPLEDTPCGLTRQQARERLDAPPGTPLELAFPAAGVATVLAAIRRIEALPAAERPLLLLADHWQDAERIRQYATLRRVPECVRFCGSPPEGHRATLVAAASLLHVRAGTGPFRGEAARIAWINGTPICAADGSIPATVSGKAEHWVRWGLGEEPPAPTPATSPARTADRSAPIAVFMPSWRCRAWLPEAIAAVLNQTHDDLHLFVCDDGGEDLDAEILHQFPQATFLATKTARGPYAIVNMLSAITRSEFIAFQDADDSCDPNRLSMQLGELLRLELDAVGCNSRVIDIDGALIGVETRPTAASVAIRVTRTDVMLHPTSLFRRSVLEELGGFDSSTRFGADTELHFRAALAHDLGNVQQLLYTRRERPASLTRSRSTGFGSAARVSYSSRVSSALDSALSAGTKPSAGYTLSGLEIEPPDLAALQLVRPGRDCARWIDHARAAQMRT